MMLSTASDQFLTDARLRGLSPATLSSYTSDLKLLVSLATVSAADSVLAFTPTLVRDYFLRLSAKGLSMATLHRRRASISEFGKWCLLRRLIAENPMAQTPGIKRPKRLPRSYAAEAQAKLNALTLGPLDAVLRGLLFHAGLRVSEVAAIRVRDVDLGEDEQAGTILVHGKGNKERRVPLTPELWHLLRDYMLAHANVEHLNAFVIAKADGRPFTRRMIERRTRLWGVAARLDDRVIPHRFRHSFATNLLEKGADIRQVQELLGHTDINTTALYLEVTARRLRSAVNLLSSKPVSEPSPEVHE